MQQGQRQFVETSERISETYHPNAIARQGNVRYVSVPVITTAFIFGAMLIAAISLALDIPPLEGLCIYAFIAGPISLATLASRVRQVSQATERTVILANDEITLTTAGESESHPLRACCWFRGKVTDDSQLSYQPIRGRVLLVVFPTGQTVACGFDESYYSRWHNALQSHHCRKVLRQEGLPGILFGLLVVCGFAAGGYIGWRLGEALRNTLVPPPAINQAANVIPASLAILLAWVFAILPWFIPGWRRHTTLERHQFTRFAVRFPIKVAIPAGVMLSGNLTAGIVLAAVFVVLFLVLTRFTTQVRTSNTYASNR